MFLLRLFCMLKIHSEALNPMALVWIINFYAGRGTFFSNILLSSYNFHISVNLNLNISLFA